LEYQHQVLCIDDQEPVLEYLARHLAAAGFEVLTCRTWAEAKRLLESGQSNPELIFFDPQVSNGSTVSVRDVCRQAGAIPVVALSSSRDPRAIVKAIQEGARDYLCTPLSADELRQAINELACGRPERPAEPKPRSEGIYLISQSRSMEEVRKTALQVAKSKIPVLITGETGVGKDVIARFIHEKSRLSDKPFVKVNCAALPTELVESELFGHRKGAFTGAYIDRPGKFEFANHGTIFLDEIAELSASVQAKLLQVLQDGQFSRLGGNEEVQVDVRVIAATNRKLEEAIREGKFREDLYYRLNVVNINVAPLRHRKEEIPTFCRYFLEKFSRHYDAEVESIPNELMEAFQAYHWPGNVRELENLVRRYVVLQDAEAIRRELAAKMNQEQVETVDEIAEDYLRENDGGSLDLKEVTRRAICQVERNLIVKTLRKTHWNKSKAAKELGVSYKTLLTKIEQYEIRPGED
jgi:DNA-binding NtrC family response regulator